MPWLNLKITTDPEHVEQLGELFEQFEAASISFSPATDEPVFDEPSDPRRYWQKTTVSALLDSEINLDILLACARNRIGTDNIGNSRIELLKDENWQESFQNKHGPMLYGNRLCVSPSWAESANREEATIILDPGLAFGSGSHATTALCLGWLAGQDLSAISVIDYGCGSGILGLAAARLGATAVYTVDIDPQAILATQANAIRNKLDQIVKSELAEEALLPQSDVLIANILLNPLVELAQRFSELVKPGGKLALSGILAVQIDQCLAAYSPWFNMHEPEFQDEWALVTGIRQQ